MKKTMMLAVCACLSLSLPVQSAYMFYDDTAQNSTNAQHFPDAELAIAPASDLLQGRLLTSGDSSTAKIAFIEEIVATVPTFRVTTETIHPKVQKFNSLQEAQEFVLNYLKETTQAQLQRELQEQQLAAQTQRQEQQARAFNNPYLTGGKRKKRRYG